MDLLELKKSKYGNTHPWEQSRLAVIKSLFRKHGENANLDKTNKSIVIDIGCGDAFVVSELAKQFPNQEFLAYDINFTQDELAIIRERFENIKNLEIQNNLEDFKSKIPNIKIVLLLDVIEHIEDDTLFLTNLKQQIPVDFKLIITVPAYQKLFSIHDYFVHHYRRYNKKELNKAVNKSGYSVQESNYFFVTLLLPRILTCAKEKMIKKTVDEHIGVTQWNKNKFITLIVKNILILDFRILQLFSKLGIHLPGLSVYCICKQKQ